MTYDACVEGGTHIDKELCGYVCTFANFAYYALKRCANDLYVHTCSGSSYIYHVYAYIHIYIHVSDITDMCANWYRIWQPSLLKSCINVWSSHYLGEISGIDQSIFTMVVGSFHLHAWYTEDWWQSYPYIINWLVTCMCTVQYIYLFIHLYVYLYTRIPLYSHCVFTSPHSYRPNGTEVSHPTGPTHHHRLSLRAGAGSQLSDAAPDTAWHKRGEIRIWYHWWLMALVD